MGHPELNTASELGCYVQVAFEELVCFTFKINKHDAVSELGMAGDYEAVNDGGIAIEPEREANTRADSEWDEQLDVTTSATEVGGFEARGDVAVFLMDLDLDLSAATGILAAIRNGCGGGVGMGVERLHAWLRSGGSEFVSSMVIIGRLREGV
jgi:hypothetical protein